MGSSVLLGAHLVWIVVPLRADCASPRWDSFVGAAPRWDTWLVECCQSIRGWRVWVRGRWPSGRATKSKETTEDYARLLCQPHQPSRHFDTPTASAAPTAAAAERSICCCTVMHNHSLQCPVDSALGQYCYVTTQPSNPASSLWRSDVISYS